MTACGSRKSQRIDLPADFKGPAELERIYKLKITPEDNIYLYNEGAKWIGVKHRLGGTTKSGVDCSGLVCNIYKEIYGKRLSRSADQMMKQDCVKVSKKNLKEGDLVFFKSSNGSKKKANHVGIYLKNGKFIHTSTTNGVIISNLSEPYYLRNWICGGRIK
jgi:cell wall-associated NlpC family hydrolase